MLNRIDEAYRSQVRFVSDASQAANANFRHPGLCQSSGTMGKNDETTMQEAIDAIKSEAESMKELIEQLLFLPGR
jgi:methylphosphotriester-DNA--protein-cysteine methyltransferase